MPLTPTAIALFLVACGSSSTTPSTTRSTPTPLPTPPSVPAPPSEPAPAATSVDAPADGPILTLDNARRIKAFILERGDRETYGNRYNRNPHYRFPDLDAYLNPDVGQRNINCDPALSDFDEIVVRRGTDDRAPQYLTIRMDATLGALVIAPEERAAAARAFATILEHLGSWRSSVTVP